MKKVFVDTSGWLSILLKSDVLNSRATKIYSELLASDTKLVTHEGVLFEIGNALSSSKSRHIVIKLKESIDKSSRIEFVSLTTEMTEEAWKLYQHRPDKDWGIIDCISIVLMKR